MICRTCLRRAAQRRFPLTSSSIPTRTAQPQRLFSSSSTTSASIAPAPAPAPAHPPPSATATPPPPKDKKPSPLIKSSIPAGHPLKGLNFLKNAQDPVALPDDAYPAWLWTILARRGGEDGDSAGGGGVGDLFSKSKKQRRAAAKALRKQHALNPGLLAPRIPLTEQTLDLPGGDGTLAGAVAAKRARDEVTAAMRGKRRAGIKEGNFLKGMS